MGRDPYIHFGQQTLKVHYMNPRSNLTNGVKCFFQIRLKFFHSFMLTCSLHMHLISWRDYCYVSSGNIQNIQVTRNLRYCRFHQCDCLFLIQCRTSSYTSAIFSITDSPPDSTFILPSVICLFPTPPTIVYNAFFFCCLMVVGKQLLGVLPPPSGGSYVLLATRYR